MEARALLIILTLFILPIYSVAKIPKSYTNFIKKSCTTTTYPSLCIKTLTKHAAGVKRKPINLCRAALTVAIRSTRKCSSTVSTLAYRKDINRPQATAVKDCIGNLNDAVDQLKQTVGALGNIRGSDREFQWSNAKTYGSAAITDAETCVDGLRDRKVRRSVNRKINRCVSHVEKLMSNALSLINHLY